MYTITAALTADGNLDEQAIAAFVNTNRAGDYAVSLTGTYGAVTILGPSGDVVAAWLGGDLVDVAQG
jgi:hypothetical protein